jgi:hypothetical protein
MDIVASVLALLGSLTVLGFFLRGKLTIGGKLDLDFGLFGKRKKKTDNEE